MAKTAWNGCSGASSMCVPRERRKVLGRRQLCQSSPPPRARRARRCKSGAAALQQDAARACTTGVSRREPVCQRSAPGHRGALQQRHIRHRPNFDLGIHALIDIVEQTNCWQKAECKEWSSLFGTLCPIITR